MKVTKLTNYSDYSSSIVQPDYDDFMNNDGDLRVAFHCAISLFHLHDWVYDHHKAYIDKHFTFLRNGAATAVSSASEFAHSLADACPEFALIRGIANSAKHLSLHTMNPKRPAPPANMPSHAANTFSESTGFGQGVWDQARWGGTPTVKLEGDNGQHIIMSDVATRVHTMWSTLFTAHGW